MIVSPIYGYGWHEGDAHIEVPAPFRIQVSRADIDASSRLYATTVGRVMQEGHQYDGLWFLLTLRSTLGTPSYNVSTYRSEPAFAKSGPIHSTIPAPVATGFADILEGNTK